MGIRVSTLDLHNCLQIKRQHAGQKLNHFVHQWGISRKPSGNLQKPAAEVSGKIPNFILAYIFFQIFFFVSKKSRNLPETDAAGFQMFLEVSG